MVVQDNRADDMGRVFAPCSTHSALAGLHPLNHQERVMHRKIAATIAALVLFSSPARAPSLLLRIPAEQRRGQTRLRKELAIPVPRIIRVRNRRARLEWRTERRPEATWVLILQHTIQPNNMPG